MVFLGLAASAFSAAITFNDNILHTENSNPPNPAWVMDPFDPPNPTFMFERLVQLGAGNEGHGPSGGYASAQSGLAFFDGVEYQIENFFWIIDGGLELYQGPGSLTQSPGTDTPGAEDYRNTHSMVNVRFMYDDGLGGQGIQLLEGVLSRLVVNVDNYTDYAATGWGKATVTAASWDGEDLYDEIMTLSNGTGALHFDLHTFNPVVMEDPGVFSTSGTIHIVPEPGTYAVILSLMAISTVFYIKRGNRVR